MMIDVEKLMIRAKAAIDAKAAQANKTSSREIVVTLDIPLKSIEDNNDVDSGIKK